MYPRAADLTSRDVQAYSDQEVFWIIKNGIRLSGMPAFGRVESEEPHLGSGFLCPRLAKGCPRGRAMTNLTTTAHSEKEQEGTQEYGRF
jgi:hypothetical protein